MWSDVVRTELELIFESEKNRVTGWKIWLFALINNKLLCIKIRIDSKTFSVSKIEEFYCNNI